MITIHFQNKKLEIENTQPLSEILIHQGYTEGSFAVALNRNFVPRSAYATTYLSENDMVEIITPMQGG